MQGAAGMSLDDLLWCSETADADSDLFTFCRELASPDRPEMIGWEAINYWEAWRPRKGFFACGRGPTLMMIVPHLGEAEWKRGAEMAALEHALAAVALPPLQEFDFVDPGEGGPVEIYRWGRDDEDRARAGFPSRERRTSPAAIPPPLPTE